jgi:hypothetical protein
MMACVGGCLSSRRHVLRKLRSPIGSGRDDVEEMLKVINESSNTFRSRTRTRITRIKVGGTPIKFITRNTHIRILHN